MLKVAGLLLGKPTGGVAIAPIGLGEILKFAVLMLPGPVSGFKCQRTSCSSVLPMFCARKEAVARSPRAKKPKFKLAGEVCTSLTKTTSSSMAMLAEASSF